MLTLPDKRRGGWGVWTPQFLADIICKQPLMSNESDSKCKTLRQKQSFPGNPAVSLIHCGHLTYGVKQLKDLGGLYTHCIHIYNFIVCRTHIDRQGRPR